MHLLEVKKWKKDEGEGEDDVLLAFVISQGVRFFKIYPGINEIQKSIENPTINFEGELISDLHWLKDYNGREQVLVGLRSELLGP